ncbi:MAG: alpha/beta fold hydrolase [Alphaproteobacteria bacterium]|nr:alpha/beta fold hydrolase [Alphaproteobacteria bacterium]
MSDLSAAADFKEGYVPVVGGKIHYVAGGEGDQTIVLLHKLGGWAAEWRWVMKILATRMRTIAIDLTGHGGSKMNGEPPFITTQEEMASQLMAALNAMGEESVNIVGSSIGGCVGAVCSAFWPERINALITVGSALGGAADRGTLEADAATAIANGYFDENENPQPREHAYMEDAFGMRNPAHMEEQTLSRHAAGRWIQPSARGVGLFDYLAILPRIEAPVLVTYGTNGNYGRFSEPAIALMKNGRAEGIPDASAFPHQDKPEETATTIMTFLDL